MILSHDCHTMACSMEGIASVLRLARQRTPYLAKAKQFKLMVRILCVRVFVGGCDVTELCRFVYWWALVAIERCTLSLILFGNMTSLRCSFRVAVTRSVPV